MAKVKSVYLQKISLEYRLFFTERAQVDRENGELFGSL